MKPLSPTMQRAVEKLKASRDGVPLTDVPGGVRTVLALMRRGLAEWGVKRQPELVHEPWHEHSWKSTMHLDACHSYQWSYHCSCGATMGVYSERSLRADPWSAVWMEDLGQTCERCEQLKAGAPVKHHVEIVRGR